MPTNNKGLNQPVLGSTGWGTPINENASILDLALGAFEIVAGTSGTVSLSATQVQSMCLKSGTAAFLGDVTFSIPSGVAGQWVVQNQSSASAFSLIVKNAASPTSVSIRSGEVRAVYSDGTKVFFTNIEIPDTTVNVVPGTVVNFAMSTAPSGYLKANGALVSRTTYAALFSAIGTTFGAGDGVSNFALPDLRGEFLRGWDDGRGVDSGRAFGSFQSGEIQAHTHRLQMATTGNNEGASSPVGVRSGVTGMTTRTMDATNLALSTGGTETRPRNIALLACIKF